MKRELRPSFTRGMFTTLGIDLFSIPMIFIPIIGQVLAFTMLPYLASAVGTRYAHPKERMPLALTAAVIWSAFQTIVLLVVMRSFASLSTSGFKIGNIATSMILAMWALNVIFTVLGARHPWNDPFKDLM